MPRPAVQPSVVLLAFGPKAQARRLISRACKRTETAELEYWQPSQGETGASLALALPVSSESRAISIARDLTDALPAEGKVTFRVTAGNVSVGNGWDTDARILATTGAGDKFSASAIVKREAGKRNAPYLERCAIEEQDGALRKQRAIYRKLPFGVPIDAEKHLNRALARFKRDAGG